MGIRAGCTAIAATAAILAWFPAGAARAANGAYAVDAADISEVGSCKVESWLSAASNTDFIGGRQSILRGQSIPAC